MEINVTVSCPDLTTAAQIFAQALAPLSHVTPPAAAVSAPAPAVGTTSAPPVAEPAQTTAAPSNMPGAAPVAAPVTAPVAMPTSAPTTPAPAITIDQLGKAGADLVALDKTGQVLPQLNGLLQKYRIVSLNQLPQEQIGAFATELRALGAKI